MWRCCLFLFALTIFSTALCTAGPVAHGKATQGDADIKWVFDVKMDSTETPHTKVYLLVGKRKILIRSDAIGQYYVRERADYASSKIPASAITACGGWWAGQGEDLYVIRRRNQLVVYIRYLDEGAPIPAYRRLKTIPLP